MSEDNDKEFDIAVVGIAGRFPDAPDVDAFWRNLVANRVSLTRFSAEELLAAGVPERHVNDADYVPCAPVLAEAARFDARFFGYSPREAELIDPQQRQLLETAWQALENAGTDPARFEGRIATFAGTAMNTYFLQSGIVERFFDDYLPNLLGADKDFLATRIAYKLGLQGPAMTVQTACSTSLVAVHLACQSLLNRESDMALVGAAAVRAPLATGHLYEEGSVLSRDGVCRPFDADAGGTVFGSGVGVVVLRRLNDALEAEDNVIAVIKGTAINNDGATKTDFTAPSVGMQADAVADALAAAALEASDIDYVEAHGTGTFLGDPIEVEALSRAFRADTDATGFCGLGSVKSNIGHLDAAAGLASLTKVIMGLEHELLPATASFRRSNPQIDFDATPFRVLASNEAWPRSAERPRRAGISSLGMGGTNAHVIVEEAPERTPAAPSGVPFHVLPLSARTDTALAARLTDLADHLEARPDTRLEDVALTLQQSRREMRRRKVLVASSVDDAVAALRSARPPAVVASRGETATRRVGFMFPGQGSQYPTMGAALYSAEPVFRDCLDRADAYLRERFDLPLLERIFAAAEPGAPRPIDETATTQPALFAIEHAYARLLASWGLEPAVLIGHSIGEYVAAALAGVFDEETALYLVAHRGRAMQEAPRGDMLAVPLPAEEVVPLMGDEVDLAVVNSADACVIAGAPEAIVAAGERFGARGVECRPLRTSHAFHSRLMDEAAERFGSVVRGVTLSAPAVPFVSNVSGKLITADEACDPSYWASQIRRTVQFRKGVETLFDQAPLALVEAGPGNTLAQLVSLHDARPDTHVAVAAGRHPKSDENEHRVALRALGALWANGVAVDWTRQNTAPGRRVPLPSYRFDGETHWLSRASTAAAEPATSPVRPVRCWGEGWKHVRRPRAPLPATERLLALAPHGLEARIREGLESACVTAGMSFELVTSVGKAYRAAAVSPGAVHAVLFARDARDGEPTDLAASIEELIAVARELVSRLDEGSSLTLVTHSAAGVNGRPVADAGAAALAASVRVVEREYPDVRTRVLDADPSDSADGIDALAERLLTRVEEPLAALRDGLWWTPAHEPLELAEVEPGAPFAGGAQVIVGASGGVGRELARHLAAHCDDLVLVGRSLPETIDAAAAAPAGLGDFLRSLEGSRARLHLVRAGIETAEDIERLAARLRALDAPVEHVFHLGGVNRDALLATKTGESVREVLAAKVRGSEMLLELADAVKASRLVLFSSTAAVAGPAGQVDYAAANAYQRALAGTARETPLCTIAWPGWLDTGMLAKGPAGADAAVRADSLTPALALSWLERILATLAAAGEASGTDNVIVSRTPPDELARVAIETEGGEGGTEESVSDDPPGEGPRDLIRRLWKDMLGIDDVGDDDNFYELGGNSLLLTQLVSRLRKRHDLSLPLAGALVSPVLGEWFALAGAVDAATDELLSVPEVRPLAPIVVEPFGELVPIAGLQRFLERRRTLVLHQWNLSAMLECVAPLDVELLRAATLAVVNHHDVLRARVTVERDRLRVVVPEPSVEAPLELIDLSHIDEERLPCEIEARAAALQAGFDLAEGRLFRVALFRCGDGRPARVMAYAHHFVTDGLSWTIVLSDLQSAYRQLADGEPVRLPESTSSYRHWAAAMHARANDPGFIERMHDWQALPWERLTEIPLAGDGTAQNLNASAAVVEATLDAGTSERLAAVGERGVTVEEVALVALGRVIARWAGGGAALIDVLGLGRDVTETFDVSRTVGYFNSYAPVMVLPRLDRPVEAVLESCCAEVRSWLARGNEHDLLRHITEDDKVTRSMASLPLARILFNSIGRLKSSNDGVLDSSLWAVASESPGPGHSPNSSRDHAIAVRLEQNEGRFRATFVYSRSLHDETTIERLGDDFIAELDRACTARGAIDA